jgi:hypothetical protein
MNSQYLFWKVAQNVKCGVLERLEEQLCKPLVGRGRKEVFFCYFLNFLSFGVLKQAYTDYIHFISK